MTSARVERRLHPRSCCRMRVLFEDEFGDPLFYVYSKDISEGGMALDVEELPLRVGSMLFLSFDLPGSRCQIRTTGQVMRTSAAGSARGGIGVRFMRLDRESLQAIRKLVATIHDCRERDSFCSNC